MGTSLFQSAPQVVTTQKPLEEATTSGGSLLGSVFNFFNPLVQNKPDIILHDSPAIKTLPAPDLTKSGPHLAGGYAENTDNLYVEQIEAKRRRDRERYNQHYRHPEHQSNNEAHQSHHQNDHHSHHEQQQQLQQQYQHQQAQQAQQASHHQSHQRDPQTHIQLHEPEHHVQHHQPTINHQQRQPTSQHHHTQQHQHQPEEDHIAQPSFVDVKLEHFVP